MATTHATSTELLRLPPTGILLAGIGAVAIAGFLTSNALIAFAVASVLVAIFVLVRWPEAAIPVVFFLLYLNAPVVAVKFHNMPRVLGVLSPLPLLAPLIYYVLFRREKIILTATFPWILFFFCVQIASAMFSRDPNAAIETLKTSLIEGLGLYLVVTNVVRKRRSLRIAVCSLVAAGAIMGGLTLFQRATSTERINYAGFAQTGDGRGVGFETTHGVQYRARASGPIGEQNRYAQVMLMLVPMGVFCFQSGNSRTKRWIAGGALALTAAGAALTYSRGGAVAFGLVLVLMVYMRCIKFRHLIAVGVIGAISVMALPEVRERASSALMAGNIFRRTGTAEEQADGAVRGRATAMLAATRVFFDHPLIGVGPGMFNTYAMSYSRRGGLRSFETGREAHCLYLEIAAEQGLFGILSFSAIIMVSLTHLVHLRRLAPADTEERRLATCFILVIAFYLTTGLFLHLSYVRYFWLVLGLADATARIGMQALADATPNSHATEEPSAISVGGSA